MSEFIVIWMMVMVENISSVLTQAGSWFTPLLCVFIALLILPNVLASNKEACDSVRLGLSKYRKWVLALTILSAILGTLGSITPNKKEMAIILGAGATYKVLTSSEAKEIGGKSIELLNKKLDDLLKEESKQEPTNQVTSNKEVIL